MAQETWYIIQSRHKGTKPSDFIYDECCTTKTKNNLLEINKQCNYITVAVWTIKLKPNATA